MSQIIKSSLYPGGQRLEICRGDLTEEHVDAIVNAANSQLAHGGGIAAAIAHKGGPQINRESQEYVRQHGLISHARPAFTSGGDLPCRYVIHAVGPVWGEGNEDAKLSDAIRGSLALAVTLKLKSIAFPAISTGIFRFPVDRAADIFYSTLNAYFSAHTDCPIQLVRIVLYDQSTLSVFTDHFIDQKNSPTQQP
jgi:O-acetyl-ADP-ribose deacetylase (regulator of RNase III)